MHDDTFSTIEETSKILRVSRITIHRKIHKNEIPYVKIGRRILVPNSFFSELAQSAFHHTNSSRETR